SEPPRRHRHLHHPRRRVVDRGTGREPPLIPSRGPATREDVVQPLACHVAPAGADDAVLTGAINDHIVADREKWPCNYSGSVPALIKPPKRILQRRARGHA